MSLLDQCACGGMLEGEFIRKRTHFQSNHPLHHLEKRSPGNHTHLNLRGKDRAASAAQYPIEECKRIVAEGLTPYDAPEGGRIHLSEFFKSQDLYSMTFSEK